MKIIKKIAAIMLSVMMVLGMCSVVGAEEAGTTSGTSAPTGSITIKNAIVGQKYKIYRILELESYDPDKDLYSYKPVLEWKDFFDATIDTNTGKAKGAGSEYITVDDNGYARWKGEKTDERKREFAKLALKYAIDNNISKKAEDTANASGEEATTKLTFVNLPLGYYLVDSSAGALCSLDTTNPNATIEEKNGVPSVKKEVQEDSKENQTDAWGDENTADIGQIVNFKTTITAKKGAENYVLHDTMSAGLTFDNKVNVTLKKNNGGSETKVSETQYKLVTPGTETEGTPCTFEVKFEKALCDTLENDDQLIVTYSATLNENAVIGKTGNTNEAKLEYGDKKTISSQTTTKTYEIPVFKYTNKNGTNTALEGAVFELYRDVDCTTKIEFINKGKDSTGNYDCYRIKIGSESNSVGQITTSADGKFKISGLDEDTYYLKEVSAPEGYNKLSKAVKITIGENGTITVNGAAIAGTNVEVENKSGSLLPNTGGMGTTLFYIFGAILVIGSGVVLITKKRMK